jgi:hypothetical protein
MHVLGIGEGPDASAALATDDRMVACEPQAAFDGRPRSRAFPWEAADDLLRRRGLSPRDIDQIAIAGRFTPPFFLRRRPGLRRFARTAFSPAIDLAIFYQAMLRQSGLGALEADRTAEWLERQFVKAGYRGRVLLVDIHTALANAAYRAQPDDHVLIVTLHPMGDGVSLAVHEGHAGQIDRHFEQRGFSSLHVHMRRCAAALGLPDARAMWGAAGPESDPALVSALSRSLRPLKGFLSRNSYPFPERTMSYDALRRVPVAVAAASVLENLSAAVSGIVAHHVRLHGLSTLCVAGEVFESTRVVAALANIDGIERVHCLSEPGFGSLAWGAAAHVAGLPMRSQERVGEDDFAELASGGEPVDWRAVGQVIGRGGSVAHISGRSGLRSWDDRCIWSRADRGSYVSGQRVLWNAEGDELQAIPSSLRGALENGTAAIAMPDAFLQANAPAIATDGFVRLVPVNDGPAAEVLRAVRPVGIRTLRSVRLQRGGCPVATGADAVAAAREAGAELLVAGPWQVRL